MASIKVVLAEDHHIVRMAVAAYLDRETDIEVIGEVSEGAALLPTLTELEPDLLLLDAHLPGHRVIDLVRKIHRKFPAVHILVLSAYDREEYVVGLLREGAAGYVLKDDAPEMLIKAIHVVANGGEYLSPRVSQVLLSSIRQERGIELVELTPREQDVLCLMAKGMRNEQIAADLSLTNQTVKNYVRAIFRKLKVETRVEAVLAALNAGLVALEPWNTPDGR